MVLHFSFSCFTKEAKWTSSLYSYIISDYKQKTTFRN